MSVLLRARTSPSRALALLVLLAAPVGAGAALARARPRAGAPGHYNASVAGGPAAAARVGHLQVTEIEYRLLLSRGVLKAGAVDLEALDRGMDPHDLHLRALSSTREVSAPQLTPGQRWDGTVVLKPGIYRLWCSLPEHAARGMRATLEVVR